MNVKMKTNAVVVAACVLAACAGEDAPLRAPLVASGPHVVGDHLVWVNQSAGSVVWLDPSDSDARPSSRQVAPVRSVGVSSAKVVLLDDDRLAPRVEVVAIPEGTTTTIDLDVAFERVLVTPSGGHAILIHDARIESASNVPAQNHNEIAVVDLAAATAVRIALDTESTSPRRVVFSSDERRAAVVLDAAVVVIDLADPTRRVKVPLVLPGGVQLTPEEVLFSVAGDQVLIRALGTPDVLVLTLVDEASLSGSLNFLSVAGAVRLHDLAVSPDDPEHVIGVFERAEGTGSLAAKLRVDGNLSGSTIIELDGAARQIALFDVDTVLLHGAADTFGRVGNNFVAGWDLAEGRVEQDRLAGPSMGPPALGTSTAFFLHTVGTGPTTALTALSIERSELRLGVALRPLVLGGSVRSYLSARDDDRVVLGVDITREDSGAAPGLASFGDDADRQKDTGALAVITPDSLDIATIVLDDPIDRVGVVGDYYFAVHPSPLGDVTIVPKAQLKRDAARRYDGVLLTHLFDRTEVR